MSALHALPRRRSAADAPSTDTRPDLRVVGPARHGRRWVVILTLVAFAGVFGVVSLGALAAEAAFAARALEQETDALEVRYAELTAEVAALEAPQRIREVATAELGMVEAQEPAFLVADSGSGGAADAEPAEALTDDPVKPVLSAGH